MDFGELLILAFPRVLEESLGHDQAEAHVRELDRGRHQIGFEQVRGRSRECDIDSVITDILREQRSERPRAAADIEQVNWPPPGQTIDYAGRLLQPEVWFGILQVFLTPEIFVVELTSIFALTGCAVRTAD